MEQMNAEITEGTQHLSADPLPSARNYQLEALEAAIKKNTIVFLETGSGKTLIAVMLLRNYAYSLRKPSPFYAVFLVPTVALVHQGFIRNEPFDPKTWIVPGDNTGAYILNEEQLPSGRIFFGSVRRKIISKSVADVVEALIGAFLDSGGELAALSFMDWLGIKFDSIPLPSTMPIQVSPEKLVNLEFFESLLKYKFHDASLLVEALVHGSYVVPEILRSYQRLEFLGDAVLDYLITLYMYRKHPWLSPQLLTKLRSASVNNDCYAQSAVRAGLHKHIIHASEELHRQIFIGVQNFEKSSSGSTFGWESETPLPNVLGDIIESLAGAIYVDSGYNTDTVFQSMRPLLEPMITPETLKLHPVMELNELCQMKHYEKNLSSSFINGKCTITSEVEANGDIYKGSSSSTNRKTAERLASREVLKFLKENISTMHRQSLK